MVEVGDVVEGKSVTKGLPPLRDLGEPGPKLQLGGGRRDGKGEGRGKGSNRDWIPDLDP